MNIIVCIKQVPDVDDIKWTKENNLDRANMLSKINLYDKYALDFAIKIKNTFKNVNVIALSMGPNQAIDVLKYAIAKGATRGILLSDKAFSASDTLATSTILKAAISKFVPDFDLIITGQLAQDGDTAQVPVSLAQKLNIIDIGNVVKFINADKNIATIEQKINETINIIEVLTPCLIAVKEPCQEENPIKIDDYIRSQNTPIEIYNLKDLELDKNEVGILGSPTYVIKAFRPEENRRAIELREDIIENIFHLIEINNQGENEEC